MARKATSRNRTRVLGAALLVAALAGLYGWWSLIHWQPPRSRWPMQGVEVGSADGPIDWRALKATGANFAYLDATASVFARDTSFAQNLDDAHAARLKLGALHRYDPCQPAGQQAANFVTVVPRDVHMLPPAIELDRLGDDCPIPVGDAAVQSELTTFLNQIETHEGKPVILKLSAKFEARYHIAAVIDRGLWLTATRFEPDYAGRPWQLWTANRWLRSEASEHPLQWLAAQS